MNDQYVKIGIKSFYLFFSENARKNIMKSANFFVLFLFYTEQREDAHR